MSNEIEPRIAKVYFSPMRLKGSETLLTKLEHLVKKAGIESIDFDRKFTAIKLHFGESGNLAYLRPNYAKVIVDLVRGLGGRPFITDCNTLYAGRRKNALEHLDLAYEHGYSPFSTGCHVLIGDGLTGQDEVKVPVPGGVHLQEAKIGRAIMDADIFISLSHFKGHIETGFGGAIKNIGMGCGSRAGKMEMHAASGPTVKTDSCIDCKKCAKFCASDAISYFENKAYIDPDKCVGCGLCIGACPTDSIQTAWDEDSSILDAKMVEYAAAVLNGRPHFHISLIIDVSPKCDCWGANDSPIVPNIGMAASFDPVALDLACADLVNAQTPVVDSLLGDKLGVHSCEEAAQHSQTDFFTAINPTTNWKAQIEHGVKIGLGRDKYELIRI